MEMKAFRILWLVPSIALLTLLHGFDDVAVQGVRAAAREVNTYYQIAFSNAAPGAEDEYNQWMDLLHVHDMLSVPGYVDARRLRPASAQPRSAGTFDYLTMFRISTN